MSSDAPHIYAVLLHHADIYAEAPAFMTIRFPLADLDGYHADCIDLSFYCGRPASDSAPLESIEEVAKPKLKIRKNASSS
ncbi:MAG: hypothetical protein SGI77_10405 [Pirellulaceae bacterium]|nr:hypothetical protein [Pirellulaceae bacterium]